MAKGPRKGTVLAGRCREFTDKCVDVLVECLADVDPSIRLKAVEQLLNRGWGKAPQQITLSGDEDNPVRHKVTIELIRPNADTGGV